MTAAACNRRAAQATAAATAAVRAAKTFVDRMPARLHVAHPDGNAEKTV